MLHSLVDSALVSILKIFHVKSNNLSVKYLIKLFFIYICTWSVVHSVIIHDGKKRYAYLVD